MLLLSAFFKGSHGRDYKKDVFPAHGGNIEITFIAHASIVITYSNKVYHIDPVAMFGADYSKLPEADFILVTHSHPDHLDASAIKMLMKDNTVLIGHADVVKRLGFGIEMSAGDEKRLQDVTIKAVPAYNMASAYHPRGTCIGYVLTMGGKNIYIAGDTENIPEMGNLSNIDIAFLPMNRPYTMTPAMVADAALKFRPKILYPYHNDKSYTGELMKLLGTEKDIEIRIRF